MIFIYGLRLVSDLAFYFFFANCIVKSTVLALIPGLLYAVYLIVCKKLDTDWDRQSDFFSKSWKIFLVFGAFVCLIGKSQVFIQHSIPMAILCLTTSIMLMRMLRHGADIYMDIKYQIKNVLSLCVLLITALVLSSQFMLNTVLSFFGFMYNHFVLPVLTFFVTCLTGIIGLILKLLSWFHLTDVKFEESHLSGSAAVNPFAESMNDTLTQSSGAKLIFTLMGIIVLLIGIFFLFRWLSSHEKLGNKLAPGILLSREELPEKSLDRSASTINQVRRQYRKYLKLCKSYGAQISKSDTSASIEDQSDKIFTFFSENSEIRDIYINARYNNHATKADVRKLKQMYQTLKQKL